MNLSNYLYEIDTNGFAVIENVLDSTEVSNWIAQLDQLFQSDKSAATNSASAAVKNRKGAVYAARNILTDLPACCDIAKLQSLTLLLTEVLGSDYGLSLIHI